MKLTTLLFSLLLFCTTANLHAQNDNVDGAINTRNTRIKVKGWLEVEQPRRMTLEFLPLTAIGQRNHFWRKPDYKATDGIHRNERFFNRQMALRFQHMLLPDMNWKGGGMTRLYGTVHFERAAWELNDAYTYYLGGPSLENKDDPTDTDPLLLNTYKGISLEQTTLALGGEFCTWSRRFFRWSFGGGVALHHFGLRADKNQQYTPWALDLKFKEPFDNATVLRPYGEAAIGVGSRIYLNLRLRFDLPQIRTNENYSLFYEEQGFPLRPVRVEGKNVQLRLQMGVGVQF
jgi:hypothetical protein